MHTFTERLLESQEQERKRVAAELHDGIGQNLFIIKNRAHLALASNGNAAAMAAQLKEISDLCTVTIEETRRTSHKLGPRHLEQLGLTEAMDAMIDRIAASTGIHFERRLEKVDDLFAAEPAANLYRIAQEALNNVMKHAHASSAKVELLRDVKHVQLTVQDNGCGFEMTARNGDARNRGVGLVSMRERVRILDGKMRVHSRRGAGTILSVTIPCRINGVEATE